MENETADLSPACCLALCLALYQIMDYSLLVGIATHPPIEVADAPPETVPVYESRWQKESGGLLARDDEGNHRVETYFIGIIDILQEYNTKKKLEHVYKAQILRKDPTKISAVNPVVYGDRFLDFMITQVLSTPV